MFAKLFDSEFGQILVKLDSGDRGEPEIRIYFKPEGLGVCSIAFKFEDNEGGWDKAEKAFERFDKEAAVNVVRGAINETMPSSL